MERGSIIVHGNYIEQQTINVNNGGVLNFGERKKPDVPNRERMPMGLKREEAQKLYEFLCEEDLIANTSMEHFVYLMGVDVDLTCSAERICWVGTKQQLRTMLECVFSKYMEVKGNKANLERLVPSCFCDKGGMSLKLSKRKNENSFAIDKITSFCRTLSDQ